MKAVTNIYKTFYYSASFLIGYYLLKDRSLLPPSLGGTGDLRYLHDEFPFVNFPRGYSLYFAGTMGYHLHGLLHHSFAKKKSHDYMEMILHHLATIYLYGFSYLTHTMIGGVIAILHDIADIFVCFTRIWAESEYKGFTAATFSFTLIVWFYTRIYVFSIIIYHILNTPVF